MLHHHTHYGCPTRLCVEPIAVFLVLFTSSSLKQHCQVDDTTIWHITGGEEIQ